MADVIADHVGLVDVQHHEEPAVRDGQGLGGGRLRFLVPYLAVNDRREPVLGVPLDVLPDVQNRAAGRIHHDAADLGEPLHLGGRDAECRQHDDVIGAQRRTVGVRVAEKLDALAAQPVVDVRVMDDFAGQEHTAIGKPLSRLIGVVDRAIDAVTEAELAREVDREAAGSVLKVVGLNLLNEVAVVVLIQLGRDRRLQIEAFPEHEGRGHWSAARRLRIIHERN